MLLSKIFRWLAPKMCPSTLTLDVLEVFARSVHFPMACLTFTNQRTEEKKEEAWKGWGGRVVAFLLWGAFSVKSDYWMAASPSIDRMAVVTGCHGLELFKFSRHWRLWGLRRAHEPALLCRLSPIKLDYARNVDSIGLIDQIERTQTLPR